MNYSSYNNDQFYYESAPAPDYEYYEVDYSALTRARWAIFAVLFVDILMWFGITTSLEFRLFMASPLMICCRALFNLVVLGLATWQISTFPSRAWQTGGYILMGWAVLHTVSGLFAPHITVALATVVLAYGLAALCRAGGTDTHMAGMIVAMSLMSCALEYAAKAADAYAFPGSFTGISYLRIVALIGLAMAWWKFLKRSAPEPDYGESDFEAVALIGDHRAVGALLMVGAMFLAIMFTAKFSMTVNLQ